MAKWKITVVKTLTGESMEGALGLSKADALKLASYWSRKKKNNDFFAIATPETLSVSVQVNAEADQNECCSSAAEVANECCSSAANKCDRTCGKPSEV